MKRTQQGFTLVEIAIVLVIIGLLLGGVLKGQELITGARVRNLISQQDGIKAAFFGFQDRYRALPGDYAAAQANISASNGNGNGNGRIEDNAAGPNNPIQHEEILAWNHLTMAGFMNGSYTMASSSVSVPEADNTPVNPYSVFVQIIYDNAYGIGGSSPDKHNLKTGGQVPVEIIAEVDRKVDDGRPDTGAFRFSDYAPPNAVPPGAGCYTGTPPLWNVSGGDPNCGGASLF